MEVLPDEKSVVKDELFMIEKCDDKVAYKEAGGHKSDEDYLPSEESKKVLNHIPLDYKIKAVNLAREHPKWRLKTLQKNGCNRLRRLDELSRWKKDVENGGSKIDKYNVIDTLTFERFLEARKRSQLVSNRNLQQWALAAAKQYPELEFKATETWVQSFKNKHRIRERKITKFVSERKTATTDETLDATHSRTFSNTDSVHRAEL